MSPHTTYPIEGKAEGLYKPKKKRFVVGDIHGAHRALVQVLKKSLFRYDIDQLICIGDVADGWSEVPQCFDELLAIDDMIYILGNHDEWLYQWFRFDLNPHIWLSQGGIESVKAYMDYKGKKERHEKLLENAHHYYVVEDVEAGVEWKKLFVHGGYDWHRPVEESDLEVLIWDRHLWETALYWENINPLIFDPNRNRVREFDEVFIGHTTTSRVDPDLKPVHASNVWNVDQGAGWEGKLTLMDIDTKEYWQSDIVSELYPESKGRRR
jgi:serine/threonine protein phosphatase 1